MQTSAAVTQACINAVQFICCKNELCKGRTVKTQIQAANLAQTRLLLQHLHDTGNVVSLLAASA
jgi:hypothetical protein